ncbi:C4-dicarboxylate transporter DcuC [Propionivibrio dicarboxylicus]|uniref:C4-dicarboxylate transporter, DcuC family n=1 Tax=Propionivibrio dicarboxylicus TaxID=83767 RepID=A0A1G8DET2_9RHOO|nr:C4-dicarboxylate transporter DcuC [Propionivibrio dicarboxylicus]SDH56227.1 C4-dicarboxylate transporter, DcuC family [Propionivibrio dicarboxylicus]
MLIVIGAIVVAITVYLMVKQYETRLVLFGAGMFLALCAGEPMAPFKAFSHAMQENKLFEAIIAVMGFAMVMKLTQCDQHLIQSLVKPLRKAGPLLIPGATLVTFFINTSITSSAGCSAAVGSILIPIMLAAGVHPAIAAAAIYAGTYGAIFNPGYAQVALVAEVAKASNMEVVSNHFMTMLATGMIGAFSLLVVALLLKENKGYVVPSDKQLPADFSVHPVKALVPLIPLVLLLLGSFGLVPALKQLAISHAMIIGVFVAFAVTRTNPQKISKEFWHGAGDSFGHVFGIIICALVFVSGLKSVGMIQAMTDAMVHTPAIAKISATFGPFILGVLSGSGDAAAVAFNRAVTPEAAKFGLSAIDMGSAAAIAGALGRSMSPIAGGMVICAGFAGCSPLESAKRNAPGMFIACCVTMWMMLYK